MLSKEEWDLERPGYMCMHPSDAGDLIEMIELVCSNKKIDCKQNMNEKKLESLIELYNFSMGVRSEMAY